MIHLKHCDTRPHVASGKRLAIGQSRAGPAFGRTWLVTSAARAVGRWPGPWIFMRPLLSVRPRPARLAHRNRMCTSRWCNILELYSEEKSSSPAPEGKSRFWTDSLYVRKSTRSAHRAAELRVFLERIEAVSSEARSLGEENKKKCQIFTLSCVAISGH